MSTKTIVEVNLASAIDLPDGNPMGTIRMSPRAVVSLDQLNQHQISKVAVDGDTQPVWNEKVTFLLDTQDLARVTSVTIRIYPSSATTGEPLGTVLIPLMPGSGTSQHGDLYPVMRPNGTKQGYVNASVRVAASPRDGAAAITPPSGAWMPAEASRAVPSAPPAGPPPQQQPAQSAYQQYPQQPSAPYPPQQPPPQYANYPQQPPQYAAPPPPGYYPPPPPYGYAAPYPPPPVYAYPPQQQPSVVIIEENGGYGRGGYGGGGGFGGGFGGGGWEGPALGFAGGLLLGEIL